jgi:hypothetical protein
MKVHFDRLCIVLAFSLAYVTTQAIAGDDDPVLMAQLARIKQQCEQQHAQSKKREQELEAAKANASLSPQKMQEVEQKIQTLKAAIKKTDAFLAQPLPTTKEARESYLRQASGEIATTRELESTVAKDLRVDPVSRVEAVLSKLGQAEDFKTKFGAFDHQDHAYNPDLNAPIVLGGNTHFFGIAGQLPPSAIPRNEVSSAYRSTTVQAATDIAANDHGTGGGIMLEGTAGGLDTVSSVEYDGSVNALVLNGDLVYFVKIPPWSLATMCREIGRDRNGLLGVSETMTEGLVFGDKPEIYNSSDMAYELMLADRFLGDVVFARPNGWTRGYKFPTTQPTEAKIKSDMLVRFAFGNFQFTKNDGQLSVVSSSLEVRMLPVSKAASPTGQMLPNYNALDNGWAPPKAFVDNAGILTNVDYFRGEPLIEDVLAYGEAAAVLRSLKESGRDLEALANQIDTGETK